MSHIYWIFILTNYFLLFELTKQQIINNPIISYKEFNEIDYILILQNDTIKTTSSQSLTIKKDFIKLFFNSYIFTDSLFLCKDESNNYILVVKDKYYKIQLSSENDIEKILSQKSLNSNNKYLGYITCSKSTRTALSLGTYLCDTDSNEIIIYGISGKYIVFYSLKENKYYTISIGNIDELISCKLLKDSIYVFIYSINNNIMISILALICPLLGNKEIKSLYSTSKSYYKILCAKSKNINSIECLAIYIDVTYMRFLSQPSMDVQLIKLNNNYHLYFSYLEDNCNFTTYNSEYLICCGKKDIASCERRDINFNRINEFYLDFPGNNSNLTFENDDDNIELIFSNQKYNESNIYEYFIYPPFCKNIQISIVAFRSFKIDISDLFERKTNTNYYISFDNLPKDFLSFQINDTLIDNDNKKLIEGNENYLNIISIDNIELQNYLIYFNIYIEETYSNKGHISLSIEPCYHSCKNCTQSIYNSSMIEHNCIECEQNYYPFKFKKSNCFSKEEAEENHTDWFFDENKTSFNLCHPNCKKCFGLSNNNCLEYFSYNITEYLYKGECLTQCPNRTFLYENNEGILICEDCYKNCETCSERGNSTQMNCDSCSDDKIIYNNECYVIYNEKEKSFYNPENELEIASCHELFGNYIK